MTYQVLDLFSGIGGFSLGLERTGGFKTVAFCEIEPFCQAVLKKHWPEVPYYDDITTLTAERLAADGIRPDVLCGGFPCQDISVAGKGAGLAGERSGLWREYARLIGEIRPRFAIVENVAALLGRGLGRVLGDLSALGYDAEWHCIPASYVGAPHRRDRLWIVAHPNGARLEKHRPLLADVSKRSGEAPSGQEPAQGYVADAQCKRQSGPGQSLFSLCPKTGAYRQAVDALAGGIGQIWSTEPNVGRVANGISLRVDRLKSLGNAVVPQIPQIIGEAILRATA